jgi:hypothetical protein
MTEPPKYVMRFYRNLEYALECIALKQITLPHIDKLNDPFDLYYYFETNCADYQVFINYVKQHHAKYLEYIKRHWQKKVWECNVKKINNSINAMFIFSTIGISENNHPKDNLYMWSHYGNSHRGVAIEFDTTLLADAISKEQKKLDGKQIDAWFEIKYQDELPEITCEHIFQYLMHDDDTELKGIIELRASLKSKGWEIEEEWRLMRKNDETKLKICRLDLIDDSITAVYLGCRYELNADHMEDPFIYETKRHFPRAEIFKAGKRKGKFALDFERIAGPS